MVTCHWLAFVSRHHPHEDSKWNGIKKRASVKTSLVTYWNGKPSACSQLQPQFLSLFRTFVHLCTTSHNMYIYITCYMLYLHIFLKFCFIIFHNTQEGSSMRIRIPLFFSLLYLLCLETYLAIHSRCSITTY